METYDRNINIQDEIDKAMGKDTHVPDPFDDSNTIDLLDSPDPAVCIVEMEEETVYNRPARRATKSKRKANPSNIDDSEFQLSPAPKRPRRFSSHRSPRALTMCQPQINIDKVLGTGDAESQENNQVGNGVAKALRRLGLKKSVVLGTTFLGLVGTVSLVPFAIGGK